jgi:hypothetical protein
MPESTESAQPVVAAASIAELGPSIEVSVATHTPLIALSAPGLGKTEITKQTAERLGMQYTEQVLGGRDIGDVMMPFVDRGNGSGAHLTFHYNPRIPYLGNPAFDSRPILFNLDEFTTANRLMQNLLLKVLDEWRIGDIDLRPDVTLIATGNRIWDKAHTEQLSSALANRGTILHFEPDLDFWLAYAMDHNFHPLVLAWVRFDPTNLFHFDSRQFLAGDYPFPSPRSNEKLSRLLHLHDAGKITDRLFKAEVQGTIGMSRGTKFAGYVRLKDQMPDLDSILASEQGARKARIPTDPAATYATLAALIQRSKRDSLPNICIYADRLDPEWHLLFTKDLSRSKPELVPTAGWSKWLTEHSNTLN